MDPIDPGYVLGRTPLSPLVVGGLLDPFSGALAEPLMSALYAASVTAWFLAARTFGGGGAHRWGRAPVPGYAILLHELSSDSVFALPSPAGRCWPCDSSVTVAVGLRAPRFGSRFSSSCVRATRRCSCWR